MTKRFTDQPLAEIVAWFSDQVQALEPGATLEMRVANPDHAPMQTSGKVRSYQVWLDLASLHACRFATPRDCGDGTVILVYQKLDSSRSPHHYKPEDPREKYGIDSPFWQINKLEEPYFLQTFTQAIREIQLQPEARILDLGVHKGDEFQAFSHVYPPSQLETMHFTGIDHCESALAYARQQFPSQNYAFHNLDINTIDEQGLPAQDLIISIGTFQSPGIDDKDLIIRLRKKMLKPGGAFILGFPCVRYVDGEHRFGAQVKNYSESELGLLIKDLFYFRRYLQQRGFNVTLRGKYYIFLTAIART